MKVTNQLLVIDWDYFFYNPMEAGDHTEDIWFYDWGHSESPFFIDGIWPIRAAAFLRHQRPLPKVRSDWKKFWNKFSFTADASLIVADSNVHAGLVKPTTSVRFDHVWLYDAHHDSGYNVKNYKSWIINFFQNNGVIDCGDWMLVHQLYGSRLHYRFPKWHTNYVKNGVEVAKGVKLDSKVDSPNTLPKEMFSHAFICRSGAWVPPWCDADFLRFVNLFPTKNIRMLEDNLKRDWNPDYAQYYAKEFERQQKELGDENGQENFSRDTAK